MLRAKAVHFKQAGARFRDRLLTSTDRLASWPQITGRRADGELGQHTPVTRSLMEKRSRGKEAAAAPYATKPFRKGFEKFPGLAGEERPRTPGKVAIFSTCYVNYNEPGIART